MGRGQELLDAARNGDKRTVEKILGQITKRSGPFTSLRRGAGVNVQDDNGYTPLHHACLNGHKEVVRILLSVDASPCIADKRGATPLHLAAWKGESNIVAMLLAHKTPPVNVDHLTADRETALLSAAHFGYTDVVAQLIAKGADVTIRNNRDESALDLAAQYGRLETVQHLLRVMPQLVEPYKLPRCRGKTFVLTPLHLASKNGRKEVVQVLLSAGIDPNIRTHNGETPLHLAACFGKSSVVRILLANGADPNAVDQLGKTVYDLLAHYPEEATRKVRKVLSYYENRSRIAYESDEDVPVPPFPPDSYSPTSYAPPNLVYDKLTDDDNSLSQKTDASTNINLGDHKKHILVSNSDNVNLFKILSPSFKKDIIEVSQRFRERSLTYSIDRDKRETRDLSSANIYANQDLLGNDDCCIEVYQNLDIPAKKDSMDLSPSLKKKPKPPPKPRPNINEPKRKVSKQIDLFEAISCEFRSNITLDCIDSTTMSKNSIDDTEYINMEPITKNDIGDSKTFFINLDKNAISKSNNSIARRISRLKSIDGGSDRTGLASDCNDFQNVFGKKNFGVRKSETVDYVNTLNLPDDEKVKKICPASEDTYMPMGKRVSEIYVEMTDHKPVINNKISDYGHLTDIYGKHYDFIKGRYVCMDRRKHQQKRRSIPDNISKNCLSIHTKGDGICIYEPLDYLYHYELNPDALKNNAHPFIRRKVKATSIPCLCEGHDGVSPKINPRKDKKNDVDRSQLVYYSCEDVYTQFNSLADFKEIEKIRIPNKKHSGNDLSVPENTQVGNNVVFKPFSNDSQGSETDKRKSAFSRKASVLKKKYEQFKVLLGDWSKAPETQENTNKIKSFVFPSSSSQLTKNQSQGFVKKLASKYLGLKAKFNSAPNISNNLALESEVDVKSKHSENKSSTNTLLIGNSKFFNKILSKKDESGEVVCTNEFDTISLDRLSTLNRDSVVNRSNRSCPGFQISLPNISENNELSDSHESLESVVITEIDCDKDKQDSNKVNQAVNKAAIKLNSIDKKRKSLISNECYEAYDFSDKEDSSLPSLTNYVSIPRPPPRPNITAKKNESTIYENVSLTNQITRPTPAARTHLPTKIPLDEVEKKVLYENVALLKEQTPEPPKRTILTLSNEKEEGSMTSRTSTLSSDSSMIDESNLEDILLSQKSKSFKHGINPELMRKRSKSNVSQTMSNSSSSSNFTEASAIENVDCSSEPNDKNIYLSMTGTLPNKNNSNSEKKVLFRHKTFTNIEVDRNSIKVRDSPKWNSEFLKDTLAHYHIRGTGHCIHKGPTLSEFIYVFNRDTLYKDVAPFTKIPNNNRNSDFETAICFCKPKPPKHHNSAEDLLEMNQPEEDASVFIDMDALRKTREIKSTSFRCFCDSNTCTFHAGKRDNTNLIVKFSAIKKSISTPDITLDISPSVTIRKSGLLKNKSVPTHLEEPYAVINVEDIVARRNNSVQNKVTDLDSPEYVPMLPSTLLSTTSDRPYSLKDISDALSLTSTSTTGSQIRAYNNQISLTKSGSEHSGHWSLQSCDSNVTVKSDASFVTCLEESTDSDDTLNSDEEISDTDTIKSDISTSKRPWVHSDSFRFGSKDVKFGVETIMEESLKDSGSSKFESGISLDDSDSSSSDGDGDDSGVPRVETDVSLVALLERGSGVDGGVRSGSGRRRWDEAEGTSEGDALSVSSAASSCAPLHLAHHHDYSKVSPTPPKKPPRRNLSVSPTHANSPSSGYSYELRPHARSQDDLDDIQGAKHYLKHGRSVDQYVESKLSYSEYEDNHNSPRIIAPVPNPRPSLSLKNRSQPVAITAMYENVVIKEQNPRRKLRRNNFAPQYENCEPRMNDNRVRKYSNQERSSLESLLDDQSMNSPSDCERYYDGPRVEIPLSPSHYDQPPTPDHPPPSARQAENSIHERIRPLSQEYKRRSQLRDSFTETEVNLLRAASAASVASGATDRSGNTDNCVEEYVCDVPFAGLFKGSTTTLDGIGLRPMPAERPKTLRKLKSVYDASPTEPVNSNNGQTINGLEDEVRRRSNTTSSTQSGDKSLSILSPFDEQEEWAKISEIMASFGSKLVRESVFVSELEQEFTSRLGLSCSESSLSPSVASNLGLWLAGLGLHDYEPLFLESGYDDIDFINGILDDNDLREMGIEETDRQKILESAKQLPLKITEISNNHNNNNISKNQNESVEEWLRNINLEIYSDTFRKHLYVDMDRVKRIWEVELTAVLEIHKPGHRKRILASVSGEHNGPANHMEYINADLNTLKSNIQQLKEEIKEKLPVSENLKPVPPPVVPTLAPPGGETLKRSKKNRPAPQPPRPSDLEIRAPSELLVGVPGALKTQWKHQPFVLVTGAVTYVANYLGSTVVKELRGTESTKKSIQKLKKSTKEPRDSPDIILSISYRGVKFLNTITRELICEHEIRNIHCACQDADDLTHFAYITKDHSTRSHYCHVFRVATMDQATEVILTLGEAFEVAYQMALREQSNRTRVTQSMAKTPTHDPMTTTNKEKPNMNHGRSHSITEIKLNGHQLKIAPIPASLSNEDFQAATRNTDGSRSPRTPLLKAPIASTEEL